MITTISAQTGSPTGKVRNNAGRIALRGLVGAVAVTALASAVTSPVGAAPGDTAPGTTNGHVEVASAISLTGLTPDFTLSGLPGATVTGLGAVTFTVQTNNLAGYAVTVQSQTATLVAGAAGNTDSIPIGALSVSEGGAAAYAPLSNTSAVTVHSQTGRSAEGGDELVNDYQAVIPFVNEDTYSVVLNYIATTL
jgi:hypothetical protein